MTTTATRPAPPAAPTPPQAQRPTGTYSKDYWDLVFEQLGRNRMFKAAMVVLALMYASAIYAPLLANDLPYSITAVNRNEYGNAQRSLYPVTLGLRRLVTQTPAEFVEGRTEGSNIDYGKALDNEAEAIRTRLDTMRAWLPPDRHEGLLSLKAKVDESIAAAKAGGHERAGELAIEAKELASAVRADYGALDPENPQIGGIDLMPRTQYPLFGSLHWIEVGFMVLWALVLAWPLWNRIVNRVLLGGNRERIRKLRRKKLVGVLGLSILAGTGWGAFGPGTGDDEVSAWISFAFLALLVLLLAWPWWNGLWNRVVLEGNVERIRGAFVAKCVVAVIVSVLAILTGVIALGTGVSGDKQQSWKVQIRAGTIDVVDAALPPLPYGFDETNGGENYRPPTWIAKSEISEEGYYVRGARVPKKDTVTDFIPPPKPVDVRYGEAPRNDPLRHVVGTDTVGRDLFTRILWGGRVSLSVGLLSAVLLLFIGTVIGAIAGYFGGWVDLVISRIIEVFLCIPAFPLILMVSAFIDPSVIPPIFSIVIIIALIRWTGVARLVRAEFLRLREAEFAIASKALGFSSARTIFRHILPNAFAPALVAGAFAVASGILTESTMSFLGFGIRPPMASWGSLINETRAPEFWWMQVFPGLLIFVTITCYNQVGDAFRDAVDPKMKRH